MINLILLYCFLRFIFFKKNKYKSGIPKIIFQTSKEKIPNYITNKIKKNSKNWEYKFFNDIDIINYFQTNPLEEFPDIINKFNYFKNGAHKADLFRYYYLYINGGVFIDSDAILEKNIDSIIKSYSFISVKSIVPNTLFNGFIATHAKNIIVYESLKEIYNTTNEELNNNYHLICQQFLSIYNKYKNKNTHLLTEIHDRKTNNLCVKTYDSINRHVISHFAWCKNIPENYNCRCVFNC